MTSRRPRLLLLTAAFAPGRSIGGRRAERMVQRFVACGWEVTVLTPRPPYQLPLDPNLRCEGAFERIDTHALMPRMWARNAVQVIRARPRPNPARAKNGGAAAPAPTARGKTVRWVRRAIDDALQRFEFPDEFAGWAPFAKAAVRGRTFDVVLATLPPPSSARLARDLAKRCQAKLVLDYRDPWTDRLAALASDPQLVQRHRSLEDACLAAADLVVCVGTTLRDMIGRRARCPVVCARNGAEVIPKPWRAEDLPAVPPLRLSYVGGLDYGRDLGPLLEAMARLRRQMPTAAVELVCAGYHGGQIRDQAAHLGIADAVRDHGEVGRDRALALVDESRASLVVVPTHPAYHYMLPAKLYEIVGRSRPVVLLGPHGCEAARLVAEHALGWAVDAADPAAVDRALADLVAGMVPEPRNLEDLSAERSLDAVVDHVVGLIGRDTAAHKITGNG